MAEDKKGFLLYADQKELFDQLPNDKAGELIKHIMAYVNDENPISEDLIINLAFTPIKTQLKRDLKRYEGTKQSKSLSGKEGNLKRWNVDLYNDYKNGKHSLIEAEVIAKSRKVSVCDSSESHRVAKIAVNDTDTVIDNVKDKVTVIDKETKPKIPKEFSEAVRDCFINCLDFFPDHYKPKNQKIADQWMDTIHKLNTIEQIPFESIEAITKWAREGWWSKNFQSLLKLRKKIVMV